MTSTSQLLTREPGVAQRQERELATLSSWQRLDPSHRLCLVERALQAPVRLLDGYPPAL